MLRRRHRDRLGRRVDAGLEAGRGDSGEFLGESGAHGLGGVEEGAASAGEFGEHAARDNVAGGEFRILVQRRHEALSGAVDQNGALAAQGLGGERRGIAADVDGGGMELHELGVGDHARRRARPWRGPSPVDCGGLVVSA